MKCPACSNELKEWLVGTIAVDVCDGGCGGIWFDAFELQKVGQAKDSVTGKLSLINRNPDVVVDLDLKRECPRCPDVKLKRHLFSPKSRVHVDQCPNCGGYWLDNGELALVRDAIKAKPGKDPNAQEVSMEVIRFMYRMRTRDAEDSTPPLTQEP